MINKDDDNSGFWKFREIKGHVGPLNPSDENYKGSKWNVLVEWETGEITLEPLKSVEHDKVMCGIYARQHDLLKEPGWVQFRKHARREKKLIRMAHQAKIQSFRNTPICMYGHLVPRNHQQAIEFDLKEGNNRWLEAEKEELVSMLGKGTFNDHGKDGEPPNKHKKINVHFVYAVKHDGRK